MTIQAIFLSENNSPKLNVSYTTISGVDQNLLNLDIYHLDEGPYGKRPVIFWIHGGGWHIGDKVGSNYDKAKYFTSLGYVFVSVNYRLSSTANVAITAQPPDDPATRASTISTWTTNRIRHPNHITDVARSLKWVYDNIGTYGGDRSKIVVGGHSAGGHLASLLCTNMTYINAQFTTSALQTSIKSSIKGCFALDPAGWDIQQTIISQPYSRGFSAEVDKLALMNAFAVPPVATLTNGTAYQVDFTISTGVQQRVTDFYATASPQSNTAATVCPFLVISRGSANRINAAESFFNALPNTSPSLIQSRSRFRWWSINTNNDEIYGHEDMNRYLGSELDPPVPLTRPASYPAEFPITTTAITTGATENSLTFEVRSFVQSVLS